MDRNSFRHRRRMPEPTSWHPVRTPQSQLNYWLRLAAKHLSMSLQLELRHFDIIASEWAALRELYRPDGMSPQEIGRAIEMTKGGISKLINRLVRKGLVRKTVGTRDRRFRTVELTVNGKCFVAFVAEAEKYVEGAFFRSLPARKRASLLDSLKRTQAMADETHLSEWISMDGSQGQWRFQRRWRDISCRRLQSTVLGSGEQRVQFFVRKLAEASAR